MSEVLPKFPKVPNPDRRAFLIEGLVMLASAACASDGINPLGWFGGRSEVKAPPPTPTQFPPQPLPDMRTSRAQEVASQLFEEAYQLNASYEQDRLNSNISRGELYTKAQDIVLRQALLYTQNTSQGQLRVVDRSTISVRGSSFKLDDPHGFVVISTLVESYLRDRYGQNRSYLDWYNIPERILRNASVIQFAGSDAPPFYHPKELVL